MSILQFLRIFWARRLLIAAATVSFVVGAYIVALVLPPRWEAHSSVMMGLLKPDPVTGEAMGMAAREYVATQDQLVQDYSVAGQVADQLGWLSDPALIAQYQKRSKGDARDYRHWLAQIVIDNTKVKNPEGSNILEIDYTGTTPDEARGVADALRKAYIDASLDFRRQDATRNADWFDAQAAKAKIAVDAAETAKASYEKQNGIVMADDKTDVDSARLRALASAGGAPGTYFAPPAMASPASLQLATVDAQIAQASKTLGPNHPELQALRAQRAVLAQEVVRDQAAARSAAGAAVGAAAAGSGALSREVSAQAAKVIGKQDKLGRLSQLQADVDLRMDEYVKTSGRAAQFREEAAVADTGLTPLSAAVTPKEPAFPNMPLIILGSLGLGLATGILVALLVEIFNRRVRGHEDMQAIPETPLLAVIAAPARARNRSTARPRRPRPPLWRPPTGKAARA
jgi:uncharacterized protein involved in exopolysaccharide biosynthesis